jgi:hypothetical protein
MAGGMATTAAAAASAQNRSQQRDKVCSLYVEQEASHSSTESEPAADPLATL